MWVFCSKCLYVHTVLSCTAVKYETHNQYGNYNPQNPEYYISFSQFKSEAQYYNHGGGYLKFSLQKETNTLHYYVKLTLRYHN